MTALHIRWASSLLFFAAVAPAFGIELRVTQLSRPFFNAALGQRVAITLDAPAPGRLTANVVDRDGFPVRSLSKGNQISAGEHVLEWDGKDNAGVIVPDEAYSLKLDLTTAHHHLTYFPAQRPPVAAQTLRVRSYDPRSGIVAYELPAASRVHIQAGSAVVDGKGNPEGPVLKTIVDDQPRIGGAVIEQWNGFDESGMIYVPDQPHFVMSLVAAPLPEQAIITVGNREKTFLSYVAQRRGTSLIPSHDSHAHHAGLQAIDDVAPPLRLTVVGEKPLRIVAQLQGPLASRFASRSTEVQVFVDNKPVLSRKSATPRIDVTLPSIATEGIHIIAFNWVGRNGPVAVNALRLVTSSQVAAR